MACGFGIKQRFRRSYNVPLSPVEINFSAAAEMWFELSFSSGWFNPMRFVGICETSCESTRNLNISQKIVLQSLEEYVIKIKQLSDRCVKYISFFIKYLILVSISNNVNWSEIITSNVTLQESTSNITLGSNRHNSFNRKSILSGYLLLLDNRSTGFLVKISESQKSSFKNN